jgi:site-specific DNA-cytosine methylase
MKVLIACEFTGLIREAFKQKGHDAWSCDLLDSEIPGQHFRQDIFNKNGKWNLPTDFDLMIAHPPCTHLAVCGAKWFHEKELEQRKAIWFFMALWNAPVPKICLENPIGIMSTNFRKPDQIIQPWQFGDEATKSTCLWLKNLSPLFPTRIVSKGKMSIFKSGKKMPEWYNLPPGPERSKIRSKTFPGIAKAMAEQWG